MQKLMVGGLLFVLLACDQKPAGPQTTKPEWETRYESTRKEADAAFTANQLAKAAELLRMASQTLPANDPRKEECAQRVATCRFLEMREKGLQLFSAGKASEAVVVFEEAIKALPKGDPRIAEAQVKLNGLRFQTRSSAGRAKMASQNWLEAIKEFDAAREFASAAEKDDLNDLIAFSKKFGEADEAFVGKKDYAKAGSLYEELLKKPHGLAKEISDKLAVVRAEGSGAAAAMKGQKEAQFKQASAAAEKYFRAAEWTKAKTSVDEAAAIGLSSSEFEVLAKKVAAAVNPPEGYVYVGGGKFLFGAGSADQATGPQQEVENGPFYITRREVTNGEFKKFLGAYKDHSLCHPDEPPAKKELGHIPENWGDAADQEKPVVGVDWFDAWSYSRWAGGRLPAEVEWEKAAGWDAKTNKHHVYPWGDDFVVGKGGASPSGLEAMGGGVLEWIDDWYQAYSGSKAIDLDFGQKRRVARGGVYVANEEVEDCKVTRRFRFLPDRRDRRLGFRIVKATP